jgi:hypothetical protein
MKAMKRIFLLPLLLSFFVESYALIPDQSKQHTIYAQWNPGSITPEDGDYYTFTGFSSGINREFVLSRVIPLFVETGVGVQYSHFSETIFVEMDNASKKTYNSLVAKIPLRIGYRFYMPNGILAFAPHLGLDLRGCIYRDEKEDILSDVEDASWHRLHVGWHVGVDTRFNDTLLVGVSYGTDISELYKNHRIHTASVTFGFCF